MTDSTLDVRPIPIPERHPKILKALAVLPSGKPLVIVSDHEPRPLRAELERKFGASLRWGQINLGDGQWQIRLVKLATESRSAVEMTVQRSDAFADAAPATLRDFAYYARRTTIKRHHCIVERGIRWPYVGIVDSGVVQAQFCSVSGRQQALYDLLPGDAFAETALLDGGQTALRYVAITADTVVVLVPKERVRVAMQTDLHLRLGIERTAAQHSRAIVERLAELGSMSSAGRLAAVLLPYARPESGLAEAIPPLPTMTQTELAIEAGSAKEVVSRALRELELAEAVERSKGRLIKLDRNRLLQAIENF